MRLQRPAVAGPLLQGLAADAVPARVGALFSLCSHAQAFTARLAVAAARGDEGDVPRRQQQAWHLATAREQLFRLLVEWPSQLARWGLGDTAAHPAPPAQPALAASSPLWRPGESDDAERLAALAPWLGERVLGQPARAWLAQHHADPQRAAARWCETCETAVASVFRSLRGPAQALSTPGEPLRLTGDSRPQLLATACRLADDPAFAARPTWCGRPCDTGPWSRAHAPGPRTTAWDLLVSRLADLVSLALDPDCAWLHCGAQTTGALQGMAWAETARGLLLHWVQLQSAGAGLQVAQYRVLAPTDWNGHPEGSLARAIARLGPQDAGAARLLALAYDPCVPVLLVTQPVVETLHA